MLVHIEHVLDDAQIAQCTARLLAARWVDGRETAGAQAAAAKNNRQLPENSDDRREMGVMIVAALEQHKLFLSAALPRRVFPPLFNQYGEGMGFGDHIDNAIRQVPGTPHRIRTDLSATLFLSDPSDYDGGELIIEDAYGAHAVKLPAGDMILYPASSVHRVATVTRGTRCAAFFWVQSLVRDDAARAILHDMDTAIRLLVAQGGHKAAVLSLTGCYHNLIRRWSEV